MLTINIESTKKADRQKLIEIWGKSVRATHEFLDEKDLLERKLLILEQYFDAVDLNVTKNGDGYFCGTHDGNVEMLFISPKVRGKGIGALLVSHVIKFKKATRVDVNEHGLGFYKHIRFTVIGRSPLDGQGKPYPLLHMQLSKI